MAIAASGQAVPDSPEQRALDGLPHYQPLQAVSGTIRLWGHGAPVLDFMGMLVKSWEEGFARFQPGVTFEYDMYGTASAMGALYTGKGDIAILGQEIYPFETVAFEQANHYPPLGIEIATGSVDVRNFDFAIGVFVNSNNPLSQMTLEQIDKVFAWHQGGKSANLETWGQLGLRGEWADKPIHLYGWHESDVFSTFVERTALHDSHQWRCGMKQYAHVHRPDGTIYASGQQILDDLASDPYGMALSNVRYLKGDAVKPLALGRTAAGPFYAAPSRRSSTGSTLSAGSFPRRSIGCPARMLSTNSSRASRSSTTLKLPRTPSRASISVRPTSPSPTNPASTITSPTSG